MAARKLSKNRALTTTKNKVAGRDKVTKHNRKDAQDQGNFQSPTAVFKAPPVKSDRIESIRAELMERILSQAPVGIVICDTGGKVGFVNGVAKKLALRYRDGE